MKIAQLAPLIEAVPPTGYGGTERVVHWLTEALVRRGVEVDLFASGDSRTSAELIPCCERALRKDGRVREDLALQLVMLEELQRRADQFDIVHSHIDYLPFPHFRRLRVPSITTMHGRLDWPELVSIFSEFREQPVVSISHAQRAPLLGANWIANVYHGLPIDQYSFSARDDGYLLFLGRICPEKRVDRAVEIARRTGLPLKVAAKVDRVDKDYFDREIAHLLRLPWVEYVGEIGELDKQALLGKARALLFPIDWPEPFGLVMIEAMACGTPVIAFQDGSVPEIMSHGVNGFVCTDVDSAVHGVKRINQISRERCRALFEERFTADRMADDYLRLYEKVVEESGKQTMIYFTPSL